MNYQPDLQTVLELARRGDNNLVPVFRDVPADLETPVSAFLKVARGDYSFLLESVEGGERLARYCFIGTEPYRVYRTGPYDDPTDGVDPLIEIEREMSQYRISHPKDSEARTSLPRFTGGAVGFLAYDVIRHFEPRVTIPADDPRQLPEALFMFVDSMLVFDHLKHTIKVVSHCRLDGDVETSYRQACWRIDELAKRLSQALPASPYPTALYHEPGELTSNTTREEYHARRRRGEEVHRRRGHHPGRPLAAANAADKRAPVLDIPRAAHGEPVAVHVLPEHGGDADHRRLAGDARAGRGRRRRDAPDRRHDATRPRPRRGRGDRRAPGERREGARRARNARRPRAQRHRAREPAGHGERARTS